MAYRIAKSRAAPDFSDRVATFAKDMTAWRTHMRNVEKDPSAYQPYPSPQAEPDIVNAITSIDGETFAADFEIVDDSPTPAQNLRLKQERLLITVKSMESAAAHAVMPVGKRRLFNMRIADVLKRDSVRAETIRSKHHEKMKEFVQHQTRKTFEHNILVNETIGKANAAAVEDLLKNKDDIAKNPTKVRKFGMSAKELADHVEKTCGDLSEKIGAAPQPDQDVRPDEDQALIDESTSAQARIDAIERHAAELEHQIEDLTAETIDEWAPTPFPG